MREDLLHFVWKTNKLYNKPLVTSANEDIVIHDQGIHNHLEGPDFFNARVEIGAQLWAGNVEIHLKSSDWFAHGHESDPNYDNVVLHVVWDHDVSVFRKDGSEVPTLEIKDCISKELLASYRALLENSKRKFINCESDFSSVDEFILLNWLDRLYIERLEQKSKLVLNLLERYNNDWEKVLFCLLMKSFGSKINGDFFLEMAETIDFAVIRKIHDDQLQLEALLFGVAGLLEEENSPIYYLELQKEFTFLKSKFQIKPMEIGPPAFFGLRPNNYPTIRLSQIAQLYHNNQNLFSLLLEANDKDQLKTIFDVSTSAYWYDHYTFGKTSTVKRKKRLTSKFIDLLTVNTILPIRFSYARSIGKDLNEELLALVSSLKAENNRIIEKFDAIGPKTTNALQSQSKIQLYNGYCVKNQCLRCAVGTSLLQRNT